VFLTIPDKQKILLFIHYKKHQAPTYSPHLSSSIEQEHNLSKHLLVSEGVYKKVKIFVFESSDMEYVSEGKKKNINDSMTERQGI
jgi:hypothetical protein